MLSTKMENQMSNLISSTLSHVFGDITKAAGDVFKGAGKVLEGGEKLLEGALHFNGNELGAGVKDIFKGGMEAGKGGKEVAEVASPEGAALALMKGGVEAVGDKVSGKPDASANDPTA
jgi:hypothetical protein